MGKPSGKPSAAKTKPAPKAAKVKPAPKKAPKGKKGNFAQKVKKEAKTPPKVRNNRAEAVLLDDSSKQAGSSKDVLNYPRGTISALLTSLKYQLKAKNNSETQKEEAQKVLQARLVQPLFPCVHEC